MNPREEWRLESQRLGRRVLVFDELDSTNSRAAALADDPANDGVVVLAHEQTAGRGQHGRSWQAPGGSSVLLSILIFPPPVLRQPSLLTAWAAVSVCETILRACGAQAKIKWPNDVLIKGRKVCGILIEQGRGTVIGIGLNVRQTATSFEEAGLTEAGSLALFTDKSLDCKAVARLLIEQLDDEYERLCQGDLDGLEARWKRRLGLLDKQIVAECHDGDHRGRLKKIGWDAIELEQEKGKLLRLPPEAVRHFHEAEGDRLK